MTLKAFLSTLLLLSISERCLGKSIGEGLPVEGVPLSVEEIAPIDSEVKLEDIQVDESALAPEEMMRMEEEPKMAKQMVAEEGLSEAEGELPVEMIPDAAVEEKFQAIIDEKSADNAEKQAKADLREALSSAVENNETLQDIVESEVVPPILG